MASPVKEVKQQAQDKWPGAVVHSRGKGWIKHQHPTELNKLMLDTQVGDRGWHFGDGPFTEAQEIDSAWIDADPVLDAPWQKKMVLADYNAYFGPGTQEFDAGQIIKYVDPESGEEIAFQVQQLQWTNDLDQIEPIADPQKITPTSIDDDTITWEAAFGLGIDFKWQSQTTNLSKKLIINNFSNIGSPPPFIINGGNPVLRLQFIFDKSSGVDIHIDGVLWDEKSNNPQTTEGDVEFRLNATGETLWYFRQAWVTDESGLNPPITHQRYRKVANNLLVEVRVPWSWLETAVYPVIIDPTVDKQIAASADDGAITGTTFYTDWGNIYIGQSGATERHAFFRWTGVTIEGTIDTSYMELHYYSNASNAPEMKVYGIDEDNPDAPTSTAEFNADPLTSAFVDWDIAMTVDQWYQSPSLNTIIQELVDSYTISNDAVMVQVKDDQASHAYNIVEDYGGSSSESAKLHIEYTVGGYFQEVGGVLTTAGVISKETDKAFTGSSTLVGSLINQAQKAFTGATTPSGLIVKQTGKVTAGAVTSSGVLVRSARKAFTGSVTAVGSLVKQTAKSITGSLTASGVLGTVKAALISISGSLTPSGSLVRETKILLAGSLTATGSIVKQTLKAVIGSITTAGSLATQKISAGYYQIVGGVLTMAGIVVRQTDKQTAGVLTATGTLVKQTAKALVGSVTTTGSLIKQTAKAVVGSMTAVGTLAPQLTFIQIVSGAVTMAGSLVRQTGKQTAGLLTMTGGIAKRISKTFTGVLTTIGTLVRQILGLPVPAIRIYAIESENRVYAIAAEVRVYSIESENRIYPIPE